MPRPARRRAPIDPKANRNGLIVVWVCRECGRKQGAYDGVTPRDFENNTRWTWGGTPEYAICGRCLRAQR